MLVYSVYEALPGCLPDTESALFETAEAALDYAADCIHSMVEYVAQAEDAPGDADLDALLADWTRQLRDTCTVDYGEWYSGSLYVDMVDVTEEELAEHGDIG